MERIKTEVSDLLAWHVAHGARRIDFSRKAPFAYVCMDRVVGLLAETLYIRRFLKILYMVCVISLDGTAQGKFR